jgi:hypothetical protein
MMGAFMGTFHIHLVRETPAAVELQVHGLQLSWENRVLYCMGSAACKPPNSRQDYARQPACMQFLSLKDFA